MDNQNIVQDNVVKEEVVKPSLKDKVRDYGKNSFKFVQDAPKKYLVGAILSVLVVATAIYVFNIQNNHVPVKQFTNVYSFVPEKISKSAEIQINLPEGIDEQIARESITFSPSVDGVWQTEDIEGVVSFKPKKPLKIGVFYAVNMDTGTVQMSGDFYVDEDPKIEAIFPNEGTETDEDSEITIVFNRPMVPLTTLTEQEKVALPITITPTTPGKFKWISTRNLQFVPDTTLIPSTDYTVEVGSGLYSLDGLPVAPITHKFVTRPLRYEFISSGQVSYRAPIVLSFNQLVDLEKTKKQISVQSPSGDELSTVIEYGETTFYDRESKKYLTEADQSKLFIYQKKDKNGRSKLWDFDTTYSISVKGAVPLYGTKDLTEGKNSSVSVPNIVENVSAWSDRSSQVSASMVDPAGSVTVSFYEDVDKNRSDIRVKGLKGIEYDERCKTDESGNTIYLGSGCEKEEDKSKLIFTFNSEAFSIGESFDIELNKIETPEGFKINPDKLLVHLKIYPQLNIFSVTPDNQSLNAGLDGMYVCSNTPLQNPGDKGLVSYFQTNGYAVFGRWSQSYLVQSKNSYNHCNSGEFETNLRYGLLPQTSYDVSLNLKDEFGQSVTRQLSFKTGDPKENYTRFHNMQQQYNVTSPNKTKLTYAVENLEYVDMHICRLEPEEFLGRTVNLSDPYDVPRSDGCTKVITEKIQLPVKYWVNNYFQINLADYFEDTRGHYIVTFSNPLYKDSYNNKQVYDRSYISVTNLAVGKKEIVYQDDTYSLSQNPVKDLVVDNILKESQNLYWVSNSKTLAPIVSASVTQYQGGDSVSYLKKNGGYTNVEGVARVKVDKNLAGAVIRYGEDTAVVTDWADTLRGAAPARDASRTYVYTDRPIYRPGHMVHVRGIDRVGFDGSYEILDKGTVPLKIYDAQGNKVYEVNLVQNEYGTFNTEYELPSDTPLGTYRIEVFGQDSQFDVEEYVPSAFKLEAESDKDEYINGDNLKIDVQADYYFGVPLTEGSVSYSVTAQDYYFDRYADEYFNFGQSWYTCYSCGYGDDFLFRGESQIDERGKAIIERKLNFSDYFDDVDSAGSKLVTVSITAKDINGRAVSMQKSFVVHKADFYIGAKTDVYYTGINSPVTYRVKTVDVDGKEIALSGLDQVIYKVNWETFKRQEVDGGFYYRSEKKLQEISKSRIKTDGRGNLSAPLTFAEEGQYEIHLSKTDGVGNKVLTISDVYIYGSKAISLPPNNSYELDLEVEKTNLEVGDTASLLIKSPYDNAKVLIAVERGTIYDYWIVNVKGGLYLHEFLIKSDYAPNIFVSALLLSGDPEVKYGGVRYEIGNKEHELNVTVTPNKTSYLPGEAVKLSVETKDGLGRPVPAEVSLAVADLSVLALKGNPKKNPALFFYDGFPLAVTTASNIKNILHEVDIPLGTKGGDGASPDDLSKKKRGLFKDTAFWEASVVTGSDGKAEASFTLPDNLTTWQIEGLGVTKDTKIGVNYKEFTTKKDLMAVPLKPRFVVPGDTFSLGAKIFNQTDANATIDVSLESNTLKFTGNKSQSVFINKGETKTVYFDVEAPGDIKAGEHTFNFTASTESFEDSVDQVIPITANTTYETVATANFTKDDREVEYVYIPKEVINGTGGLTINANATMAVFMTDALSYMVTYPYGCSEQLSSSLSTIAILKEALSLPNVEGSFEEITYNGVTYSVDTVVKTGLDRIYQSQTSSGGFSYYKGLSPSLSLTITVVNSLLDLDKSGYEIREDVLRRALSYIENETKLAYSSHPETNKELVILAEYVLRHGNANKPTSLTKIVETLIGDKAFLNEKISNMSLAYLSILSSESYSAGASKLVYSTLMNRIEIDGRGAFLPINKTAGQRYDENVVKNSALLLKAFVVRKDENPEMANVLRWLLASRDKDGVWGNTHNTFVVVEAMVDYLGWQHETESHFTLKGLLDGVEIFGYEFKPSNIFKTFSHFVSIDNLERGKLLPLVFNRTSHNELKNNLYYDIALKYFLPVESLPPRDEGITITRNLYKLDDTKEESPVDTAMVGEIVKGKITMTIPSLYNHVTVEDFIPAGFEIVNFNLATEDQSLKNDQSVGYSETNWVSRIGNDLLGSVQSSRSQGFGGRYGNKARLLRPTYSESHDDRVFLYNESLQSGVYEYEYFLRALVPGEFQQLPARAEESYFPEIFGRTEGNIIRVIPGS